MLPACGDMLIPAIVSEGNYCKLDEIGLEFYCMFANLFAERQNGAYAGAVTARINLEVSTQLSDPLSHSGDAHAHHRV